MARRASAVQASGRASRSDPRPARTDTPSAGIDQPVVVLQSGRPPHARRNPYVTQLLASLPPSVRPVYFSWRRALVGRYDVFHVHWPDAAIRSHTRLRAAVRSALVLLVLLRIRLQRKALVRTLHDLTPHDPPSRLEALVLRLFDRWTTLWIALSDRTPPPRPAPSTVVLHGHYKDWFADLPRADRVVGRILHFGLLRRYKGTEALVSTFSQLPDGALTLRIVGYPQDRDVLASIERAHREDARITVVDRYVSDEELTREVGESELVVLPFDRITNSGSLLLALSLERPVLVPALPLTEDLAAEVAPGWVLTYRPPLDAQAIADALADARAARDLPPPDLSRRDWPEIGAQHAAAFARARDLARPRRRATR